VESKKISKIIYEKRIIWIKALMNDMDCERCYSKSGYQTQKLLSISGERVTTHIYTSRVYDKKSIALIKALAQIVISTFNHSQGDNVEQQKENAIDQEKE
jgi:hypothetical protein